jgi:hypothetical protein
MKFHHLFRSVLTRAHHFTLFWATLNPVHIFMPYFFKCTLTLSSHLRLCLPRRFFRSGFPTHILYSFFISLIFRVTCLAHLILLLLLFTMIFGGKCIIWSSLFCNFLYSPVDISLMNSTLLSILHFSLLQLSLSFVTYQIFNTAYFGYHGLVCGVCSDSELTLQPIILVDSFYNVSHQRVVSVQYTT